MKIDLKKYVIATVETPMEFDDGNGENVEYISDAYLYDFEAEANRELEMNFDTPSDFKVLPVKITYEF